MATKSKQKAAPKSKRERMENTCRDVTALL